MGWFWGHKQCPARCDRCRARGGSGYATTMAHRMGLAGFERRLEKAFEGVFAKAFRSGLEPVELGRRLVRELERSRSHGAHGIIAPNHFQVVLSLPDAERMEPMAEALESELINAARTHAHDEGYRFSGPVDVDLRSDAKAAAGTVAIKARIIPLVGGGPVAFLTLPDGTELTVGEHPATMGRADDCEGMIDDATVSRRHAVVQRLSDDTFEVADLDSRNGTKVNGRRMKRQVLHHNDRISVGAAVLLFEEV